MPRLFGVGVRFVCLAVSVLLLGSVLAILPSKVDAATPVNVYWIGSSPQSITIGWDVGYESDWFAYSCLVDGRHFYDTYDFTDIAATATGLSPDTLHTLVVQNYHRDGSHADSSIQISTTGQIQLTAQQTSWVNPPEVDLTWNNPCHYGTLPSGISYGLAEWNLYRDGYLILSGTDSTTQFTDGDVIGGQSVSYQLMITNGLRMVVVNYEVISSTIQNVQIQSVPESPSYLSINPSNGVVYLSWEAGNDGGSPITQYEIYRGTSSGGEVPFATCTGTSYEDFTPAIWDTVNNCWQRYFYKITAWNAHGEGISSYEVSGAPLPPATAPSPPQSLLAAQSAGAVALSWGVPVSDGYSPVVAYRLYRGPSSGTESYLAQHMMPGELSYFDDAVVPGATYYYEITAINAVGESLFSNEASKTVNQPPVAQFTAVAGLTTYVDASASYDPDGSIVSYYWNFGDGNTGSGQSFLHEYKSAGIYTIALTVRDDDGASATHTEAVVVGVTLPSAPEELEIAVDSGDLYFRGEIAQFYVLTSYGGLPVEAASIEMALTDPGGGSTPLSPVMSSLGLYAVSHNMAADAMDGTYALVVSASYVAGSESLAASALTCFQISPTLAGWNARLQSIEGGIGIVATDVGTIKLALSDIDARIESIQGDVVIITSSIGSIPTNLATVEAKLVSISEGVVDVRTVLGHVYAGLDDVKAEIVLLKGTVATIQTSVGTIESSVLDLSPHITSIDDLLASVETSIGSIEADIFAINGHVESIDGSMVTIATDIGTFVDSVVSINAKLISIADRTATIKTDLGIVKTDVAWIKAGMIQVWGNKIKITTTVGDIVVDPSSVDTDYIPWLVEPKKGVDPAMYIGMAILGMSLFAAGALTRGSAVSGKDGRRPARSVGHSDASERKSRNLRTLRKMT